MIDKQQIVSELENRGEQELAQQAKSRLPDMVHPDQHGDQLRQLGLDPSEMESKFGQGGSNPGSGLGLGG